MKSKSDGNTSEHKVVKITNVRIFINLTVNRLNLAMSPVFVELSTKKFFRIFSYLLWITLTCPQNIHNVVHQEFEFFTPNTISEDINERFTTGIAINYTASEFFDVSDGLIGLRYKKGNQNEKRQ